MDMKCPVFNTSRRSRRWPLAVFYRLLSIGTVNAFILFMSFLKMSTWKKAVGYGALKLKLLLCGYFIILNNPIKVENFTKYRYVCHVAKLPSLFKKRTTRQRYITNIPLQANNLDRVNVETCSLHQNIYFIKIFKSSYHTVRAFTFYFGVVPEIFHFGRRGSTISFKSKSTFLGYVFSGVNQ